MFAAPFDYVAAGSLQEALKLLAQHGDRAKILAGGHSLIPAMKLRLAQPEVLIDLSRVRDLAGISEEKGEIRIGAMTTHTQIETSEKLRAACPLLPETAAQIGDVQVRNKGTIGGSLAHSDPAADWPAAILALGAELVAASAKGERVIKAEDFFVDLLTTALQPGEILREIRIRVPAGKLGQSYIKVRQPASGFALVGVAVSLARDAKGACSSIGIGVTGAAAKAYRERGMEKALAGSALDEKVMAAVASHAADGAELSSDLFASADYRRHLVKVISYRALQAAAGRAK
jgi:carbon-monoxide dehydrogenase medium subunit